VVLAHKIAEAVRKRRTRSTARLVRDVLMQFDSSESPTRFSLYAVLVDEEDERDVREWLADIAREVPLDLGIADQIEAATAAGISLHLVETSYAADVSQVTWPRDQPDPDGGT
jgi:hypothetical protein